MEGRGVEIRPRRRHCDFLVFFQPFFYGFTVSVILLFLLVPVVDGVCMDGCCDEGYCPAGEVIILGKKKAGELREGKAEEGRRETRSVRMVEVKVKGIKREKKGYEEELRYMVSSRSSRGGVEWRGGDEGGE